jgi:hypothetical protein
LREEGASADAVKSAELQAAAAFEDLERREKAKLKNINLRKLF